jgi:uncharacterized membrane-anchored protein YhcB (DUF1043 family)
MESNQQRLQDFKGKSIELAEFRRMLEDHFRTSDMIDLIEHQFQRILSGRI